MSEFIMATPIVLRCGMGLIILLTGAIFARWAVCHEV